MRAWLLDFVGEGTVDEERPTFQSTLDEAEAKLEQRRLLWEEERRVDEKLRRQPK